MTLRERRRLRCLGAFHSIKRARIRGKSLCFLRLRGEALTVSTRLAGHRLNQGRVGNIQAVGQAVDHGQEARKSQPTIAPSQVWTRTVALRLAPLNSRVLLAQTLALKRANH